METKNVTKTQFIQYLVNKGACEEGLAFAKAQDEARDILTKCERTDWLIWLVEKVGGPARAEYQRAAGAAWAEYQRAAGAAWAEYQRVEGPAWAEYKRVQGPAWAEYQRVKGEAARSALTWERVCEAVN
jgi:hypothetical protein